MWGKESERERERTNNHHFANMFKNVKIHWEVQEIGNILEKIGEIQKLIQILNHKIQYFNPLLVSQPPARWAGATFWTAAGVTGGITRSPARTWLGTNERNERMTYFIGSGNSLNNYFWNFIDSATILTVSGGNREHLEKHSSKLIRKPRTR